MRRTRFLFFGALVLFAAPFCCFSVDLLWNYSVQRRLWREWTKVSDSTVQIGGGSRIESVGGRFFDRVFGEVRRLHFSEYQSPEDPSVLAKFRCLRELEIEIYPSASLKASDGFVDLRVCAKLSKLVVYLSQPAGLRLPRSLESLECRFYVKGPALDLSSHDNLEKLALWCPPRVFVPRKLKSLKLVASTPADFQCLENAHGLETLELSLRSNYEHLAETEWNLVASLENLRVLKLDTRCLTELAAPLLAEMKALEMLEVPIPIHGWFEAFRQLANAENVRELRLVCLRIPESALREPAVWVQQLAEMRNLERVEIGGCQRSCRLSGVRQATNQAA